jgi:plasmid stability protein
MPDILVRGVSSKTAKALKLQAKNEGVSVADLARKALDDAAMHASRRAAVARLDALGAEIAKVWKGPTSLEMLREDRNRR